MLAPATLHGAKATDDAGRTLKVQVDYTGAGKIDETHKVYVVLWDTPDFIHGGGIMPVALKPATKKDDVVTFDDIKKVPAYISTAYDPTGSWDGQSGPPPSGTSLGLYTKGGATAEPIDIAPGKTVTVKVTFDDTIKMP